MTGTLTPMQGLAGSLTPEHGLSGGLSPFSAAYCPDYDGPLEFVPSGEPQTVLTAGTVLHEDITISAVPSNWGRISWNGSIITVS